jgi:hypothetical protein
MKTRDRPRVFKGSTEINAKTQGRKGARKTRSTAIGPPRRSIYPAWSGFEGAVIQDILLPFEAIDRVRRIPDLKHEP